MKVTIIILICMALLVGGAYLGYQALHKDPSASTQPASTVKVERGTVRAAVMSTGKVVSNLDVDIKCKASGEVIKLPYDVSDEVKKDSLLVQLDPIDEQREVEQAKASLAASQAKLAQARQNLIVAQEVLIVSKERAAAGLLSAQAKDRDARTKADRMKELLDKKLVAQEDFDTAQTASAQADADLNTAQAAVDDLKNQELSIEMKRQDILLAQANADSDQVSLDNALQRLSETKVMAPISGRVAALNVQIGTIISSGITNVGGGTAVMTLSDLSRIFILATVDESDIGRVALGQSVNITADSFPGKHFSGKVTRIATKGVNTSNVVTFEVKIEVTSDNKSLLKPEMTGNVEIIVAEKPDVLFLPTQALTKRKGAYYVNIPGPDGTTQERPIEVGITDGNNFEITRGVAEGDTLTLNKAEIDSRWKQNNPFGKGPPMMPPGRH
jgi:HlyD family secretion protein